MGTYLEITSITGPSEANYGDTVTLNAYVRNVWTEDILYAVATARIDDIEVVPPYDRINAGETRVWPIVFTMPNKSVIATIFAMYWGTDDEWHEDDRKAVSISLAGAPPPGYAGRIENIRVNDKPIYQTLNYGDKFRIQFDGYNDSDVNVQLWASCRIKSPTGRSIYYGDDAESYPYTDPTGHHPFEFPKRVPYESPETIDEYGDWTIDIELRVGNASGQFLARKTDVHVITVPEEVEPELAGEIRNPQIRYGVHNWQGVPVTLESVGGFSVAFEAVNKSSIGLVLRGEITITKPDDSTEYDDDFTGLGFPVVETAISPGGSHTFKWTPYAQPHRFTADEVGDYTARMVLKGKKPGEPDSAYQQLCDPVECKVLTLIGEEEPEPDAVSGKAEIVRKALDFELIGAGYEIPVTETVPVPEHARLSIIAKTVSTERERLRAEVWIYGPAPVLGQQQGSEVTHGPQKYHYADTSAWPCCAPEAQHEFIFPTWPGTFLIDEEGEWTITIDITDASDGELLARYDGVLCGAAEAAPSPWGILIDMMPLIMIMMMFAMVIPMTKELGEGVE